MSQHELLRNRVEQHKVKNLKSKEDDKNIKIIAQECVTILKEDFPQHTFTLKPTLTFAEIEEYTKVSHTEFNKPRKVEPDGGVIWMDDKYPILISEMKHQGTNDAREAEGKKRQATGNAIERYGKNLMAFHTLYMNDDILPVVAFCHGCDFLEETVHAKLHALNSFHECNKVYTEPTKDRLKPSTILYQLNEWTGEQMLPVMYDIATSAIDYYDRER